MSVQTEVFVNESVDVLIFYCVEVRHHLAEGHVVHMVAETDFGFHLVAVGYGHVVHLVAEAYYAHVLGVGPRHTHALPHGNAFLGGGVFPVAGDYFAAYAHAGADMAEFAVAVGALVQVHEVHVHGVPRNFCIVLCVQMEHGLVEQFEAMDPHFGRRECVHPCDAGAARFVVCGFHQGFHFSRGVGGAFVHHFHGKVA